MNAPTNRETYAIEILTKMKEILTTLRLVGDLEATLIDQVTELSLQLTGEESTYDRALKNFDDTILQDIEGDRK